MTAALARALTRPFTVGNMTPRLRDIAAHGTYSFGGISYYPHRCDPFTNAALLTHPMPCWFGDLASTKTIAVFGDSFVGNWTPALDLAGKALGIRVAGFQFLGCVTPFIAEVARGIVSGAEARACARWHASLPSAIRALRPVAILAASGGPPWGQSGAHWSAGMAEAFGEMTVGAPSTIRIILGTGPIRSTPAPACVAVNLGSLPRCTYRWDPYATGANSLAVGLARDVAAASASHAALIRTVQWQCVRNACPAVVDGILVYIDSDHLTIAYSKWLSVVVEKALAGAHV